MPKELLAIGLGILTFGDVVEENGHLSSFRVSDAIGRYVVETTQHRRRGLKACGHPRQGDLPVDLEPVLLVIGGQITHELSSGVVQPGELLEHLVDLEKAVVDGAVVLIEDHLDGAKSLHHSVEQVAVAGFGLARRFLA